MFGGTVPGKWITWPWFGRPLGVSNTLEWLSKIHWRFGKIKDFDVWTYSEINCTIMPRCYFFKRFVMPLDFIISHGFPTMPLNSFPFLPSKMSRKILEN